MPNNGDTPRNEKQRQAAEAVTIGEVPDKHRRPGLSVGKPQKIITSAMRSKTAICSPGGGGGYGGSGGGGYGGTSYGSGGNFYSPELSTDFLELPQSLDEQRNFFRWFYQSDPFVGQAIDLHTELPLSKVRLGTPKAQNRELAEKSLRFCQKWSKRIGLLQRLISIVHDYHLVGEVFIFVEDTNPEMPRDIREEVYREIGTDGEIIEEWHERKDADERATAWVKKNYKGWTAIRTLPPEQVHMESFSFTDERIMELIPDAKSKDIVAQAAMQDPRALRIADSMPVEVIEAIQEGENIPLNVDPDAGSFCHYMARKKSDYEPRGHSILERCIRTLVYRDKLRQAQTSIASRHMTPMRLVWAEDADLQDVEDLREQVDMALQDPDYSIITNFQVNWEELGANDRLLDLSSEYDLTDRQLYAGLGVTESLLSGESSYSGDRINLEVINTRYMLLRELMQEFVEEWLLKPMCARMGFIEEDEDGEEVVIYPTLSFTRLALRDNADTFDALFNLYQKGSLDIDVILELLNIDPVSTREKLERDLMTINDATFNEVLRGLYSRTGDALAENSNAAEKIAEYIGLDFEKPAEEGRY
jgi:hypothetical protein